MRLAGFSKHPVVKVLLVCTLGLIQFNQYGQFQFGHSICMGQELNGTQTSEDLSRIYGPAFWNPTTFHVVRISLRSSFTEAKCTGTLYNALYILTSASCLEGVNLEELIVAAGLNHKTDPPQNRSVTSAEFHKDWNPKTYANNIALLRLDVPFTIGQRYINTIHLNSPDQFPDENIENIYLIGWGLTDQYTHIPHYPKRIISTRTVFVSIEDCKTEYDKLGKNNLSLTDEQTCAKAFIGAGPCTGDEGAPLTVYSRYNTTNSNLYVVGILSSYHKCGTTGLPDIYTRTRSYLSWIESIAGRQCDYNVPLIDTAVTKQLQDKMSKILQARIDLTLAQDICYSHTMFILKNKIQTPLTKPTLQANSVAQPSIKGSYCRELKWKMCDVCNKFSFVSCKRSWAGSNSNKTKYLQASVNPKIIGGHDAKPGQHPYIVRIETEVDDYRSDLRCSGVIYNTMYILTAASCLQNYKPCEIYIIAGDYRVNHIDGTEQERNVVSIIKHEQYDFSYKVPFNDIALLKLRHPLNFTKSVQSISIADREYPTSEVMFAEVSGWGGLGPYLEFPEILQEITLPFVDECDCKLYYAVYIFNFYSTKKICTGSFQHGYCQGDKGSPITVTDAGVKRLVGIASFFGLCGNTQDPGLSTKVFAYRDWIALRAG